MNIKARAWDKKDKTMYYDIQQGITFADGSNYNFGNFIKKKDDDYHEWEVMQYTGLKDRNGKMICCGDIAKGNFNKKEVSNNIWLSISEKEKIKGIKIFEIPLDIIEFARMPLPDDLEIIGNIYQNPELLEINE